MTVDVARPQSWGVARLSFGMPKNVGRAVRKGNEIAKLYADDKVDVIIYAVEKSLDSYKFNLLHCKQTFISQLKSGAMGARTIDEGAMDEKSSKNSSVCRFLRNFAPKCNGNIQMGYDDFILTVNSSSIIILLGMAAVLLAATRFRGESGYAAAIIVLPNVPVYIYNMSRMLEWHNLTLFMFPISYSVNTLLMPLLWLFAKKNFDLNFRLKPIHLLHLLPGLLCLGLSLAIPTQERIASIQHEMTGDDTWIGDINTIIVFIQMVAYFAVIFRFLHRKKKAIRDTASDAEWVQKEWIPVFEYLFAALFVIVMACYAIWPRTDAWLIQILNVVAMFYLVYNSIAHPVVPIKQVPENIPEPTEPYEPETSATPAMDDRQMNEVCERASRYLEESKAYLRPDISLAIFAKEINIPQRTLSRSINGCLGCNFFEFINRMRVEEAKRLLLQLDIKDYNIDSIYTDCGFRSRSTFFLVFKKVTGKSPVTWLRER